MQRPNPLADPFLRRSFIGTAVTSVMVTGIYVTVAATWPTATTAWIAVGAVVMAYGSALFVTLTSFSLGWYARARSEQGRISGRWMAYSVDVDGVPTTAPMTGRLVLDDPMQRP